MSSTDNEAKTSPETSHPSAEHVAGGDATLAELAELAQAATELHARITDHLDHLARIRPASGEDDRATA